VGEQAGVQGRADRGGQQRGEALSEWLCAAAAAAAAGTRAAAAAAAGAGRAGAAGARGNPTFGGCPLQQALH